MEKKRKRTHRASSLLQLGNKTCGAAQQRKNQPVPGNILIRISVWARGNTLGGQNDKNPGERDTKAAITTALHQDTALTEEQLSCSSWANPAHPKSEFSTCTTTEAASDHGSCWAPHHAQQGVTAEGPGKFHLCNKLALPWVLEGSCSCYMD